MSSRTRPLTQVEIEIVASLLAKEPILKREFLTHASTYEGTVIDPYGSLKISGGPVVAAKPSADGPIASGLVDDTPLPESGARIEMILFYAGGHLVELQIFRQDGRSLRGAIDPKRIEVY